MLLQVQEFMKLLSFNYYIILCMLYIKSQQEKNKETLEDITEGIT